LREDTVGESRGYVDGRDIASEMGGDSGSMAIEATASDPFKDVLTVTGASPSCGWLAAHSVTVPVAASTRDGEKCFWVQLSRGDFTRFFCSINQPLVRLGTYNRQQW